MNKRYIVIEWSKRTSNPLNYNIFYTDDITEWISETIGIGRSQNDVLIIDNLKEVSIDNNTCEWQQI